MRGDITAKLLEFVEDLSGGLFDFGIAFLKAGYGASISKLDYEYNKLNKLRERKNLLRQEKDKFYKLLYKLKSDGLIAEKAGSERGLKYFKLTSAGKQKLVELKERRSKILPTVDYKRENGKFVVIAFDIPEGERRKRKWLREALSRIGLKMIQKSVWVGKVKIPKDFIVDLVKLRIIDHVEILEVSKTGSLKQLI